MANYVGYSGALPTAVASEQAANAPGVAAKTSAPSPTVSPSPTNSGGPGAAPTNSQTVGQPFTGGTPAGGTPAPLAGPGSANPYYNQVTKTWQSTPVSTPAPGPATPGLSDANGNPIPGAGAGQAAVNTLTTPYTAADQATTEQSVIASRRAEQQDQIDAIDQGYAAAITTQQNAESENVKEAETMNRALGIMGSPQAETNVQQGKYKTEDAITTLRTQQASDVSAALASIDAAAIQSADALHAVQTGDATTALNTLQTIQANAQTNLKTLASSSPMQWNDFVAAEPDAAQKLLQQTGYDTGEAAIVWNAAKSSAQQIQWQSPVTQADGSTLLYGVDPLTGKVTTQVISGGAPAGSKIVIQGGLPFYQQENSDGTPNPNGVLVPAPLSASEKTAQTQEYQLYYAQTQNAIAAGQYAPGSTPLNQFQWTVATKTAATNITQGNVPNLGVNPPPGGSPPGGSSSSTVTVGNDGTFNIGAYNPTSTDPTGANYAASIQPILAQTSTIATPAQLQSYIASAAPNAPITASMISEAANASGAPTPLLAAVLQHEGNFGTAGEAASTDNNPGGVTWSQAYQDSHPGTAKGSARPEGGNYVKFDSLQNGVTAVGKIIANTAVSGQANSSETPPPTGTPLSNSDWEFAAQQLASGKGDPSQYSTQGRTGAAFTRSQEVLKRAQQINPNFDPAQAQIQYSYAQNPTTQQNITAINRVLPNIDKIITLANSFNGSDLTPINDALRTAGILTSNQTVANLGQAQKLIGDELGSVLGSGGGSDLKTQLGLDTINPSLSPATFASNMQQLKGFVSNAQGAIFSQMGMYAPKVTIQGQQFTPGQTITDGNLTMTINGNNTLTGSDGNTYDLNGNIVNQ